MAKCGCFSTITFGGAIEMSPPLPLIPPQTTQTLQNSEPLNPQAPIERKTQRQQRKTFSPNLRNSQNNYEGPNY